MNLTRRVIILSVLFLLSAVSIFSLDVPQLKGRINDNAGMISTPAESELTRYLQAVEEKNGAQIVVLTVKSLEGESIEDFSIRVTEKWKQGNADQNNGVLLLVALKEKKIRIEVGYGLEGELTDIKSGFIIREIIQPAFKAGNFDAGIAAAVQTIGGIVAGNITISNSDLQKSRQSRSSGGGAFNFFFFFLIIAGSSLLRRRRVGGSFGRALFWGAMLGGRPYHSSRSSMGGFSSGGGFGGFSGGGGGFGGGGASGGW